MAAHVSSGVADELVVHHGHLQPTSILLGAVEDAGADWDHLDLSRADRDTRSDATALSAAARRAAYARPTR